jgi:hypothetical protein
MQSMTRILRLLAIPVAAILFTALAMSQDVDLMFSHKMHIEDVGMGCTDCHMSVSESDSPKDDLLVPMETCFNCHDEDGPCTLCHEKPEEYEPIPRIENYIGYFSHEQHLAEEIECSACHGRVAESETVAPMHLPGMITCTPCHAELEKPDYCVDCHLPSENLVPATHTVDWQNLHGIESQVREKECQMCHSEQSCLNCHDSDNLDRQVHPLNFKFNHALKAQGNKDNCTTCHQDQSFCIDCHRQELVYPRSHNRVGWSNRSSGGSHARAAMADLESCLSCHAGRGGDPVCVQCHGKN